MSSPLQSVDTQQPVVSVPNEVKIDSIIEIMPLVKSGYSIVSDIKEGWKPEMKDFAVPIPLIFIDKDLDLLEITVSPKNHQVVYYGHRPKDSLLMHKAFLSNYKGGLTRSEYQFTFPP